MADGERTAAPGADHEIVLAVEEDGEGERALQPAEGLRNRRRRRHAGLQIARDEVGDHLGVGLGREHDARVFQLRFQLAEILDDAVMDEREAIGRVRVGIGLGGRAMGRPAGVTDAGPAGERLPVELFLEIAEFPLGPPPRQPAAFERRDAGRIVTAVLQPLQRLENERRHRRRAENPDNAAHRLHPRIPRRVNLTAAAPVAKSHTISQKNAARHVMDALMMNARV